MSIGRLHFMTTNHGGCSRATERTERWQTFPKWYAQVLARAFAFFEEDDHSATLRTRRSSRR